MEAVAGNGVRGGRETAGDWSFPGAQAGQRAGQGDLPGERKEHQMKKLLGLMLAVMMLTAMTAAAMAESQGTKMYVYTQNGKGLNVRSSTSLTEDNVVDSLPYGAEVFAYGSPKSGWTYIEYKGSKGMCYVLSRYLVKNKPAPYQPSSGSEQPASKEFDTRAAVTVEQMNTLLASAKAVTPYTVTVRPVRASGWVYLRWFPSKNAQQIATFGANYQLTVIAELKDWYQVQDPATGKVGFVYKSYIQ